MTHNNVNYVHDCLKPIVLEPVTKKKNKEGATIYYHKDENGEVCEYQRGQGIADHHNSQVKSKLYKARMTGRERGLSKAMGFIITLPKDYIKEIIPDLTDDEYKYLTSKLEAEGMHKPFTTDEVYENTLGYKFGKHEWTEEEMEKAKEFLLASKDSALEEFGIRQEDVLYYTIHFDESFPHIHVVGLPTCEKTYDEDICSQKKKKDGTYTLLHKKDETEISYSVTQYYKKDKDGEYTFFKNFHENVVKRMEKKGYDASGLIRGVTSGKGFSPANLNREQREIGVMQAMQILALEKKVKALEEEKTIANNDLIGANNKLTKVINEKEIAEAEALAFKAETAKAEAAKAEAEYKIEDLKDEFEGEKIEYSEKISEMQQTILSLKTELKNVVDKAAHFVSTIFKTFIQKWEKAKTDVEKERVDEEVRIEAKAYVKEIVAPLYTFGKKADELVEEKEEIVNSVKMSTFVKTDQRDGFAKSQIQKMAGRDGKAEVFEDERFMDLALQDWFDREKHEKQIVNMSELNALLYMKSQARASRAVEYALEKAYEMDENFDRE